jgi:hypothetical protein
MPPKINEYYYCKKAMKFLFNNDYFEKGKHYKVSDRHHGDVVIISNIGEMVFSLENHMSYLYFYEYFGTIKEERKEKLNKLLNAS